MRVCSLGRTGAALTVLIAFSPACSHAGVGGVARGLAALEAGQCERAAEACRSSIEGGTELSAANNCLGLVAEACSHDSAASLLYFRKAVELDSGFLEAHENCGVALMRLRPPDYSSACFHFRAAAMRVNSSQSARTRYALCLLDNQRRLAADTSSTSPYADSAAGRARTHFQIGEALQSRGETVEAMHEWKAALVEDPALCHARQAILAHSDYADRPEAELEACRAFLACVLQAPAQSGMDTAWARETARCDKITAGLWGGR